MYEPQCMENKQYGPAAFFMPKFGIWLKSYMHKHCEMLWFLRGKKKLISNQLDPVKVAVQGKMTNSNQTTATSNLANKCTLYSSIRLKHRHLCFPCQELYPGHIFHKNNHECASVRTSKKSKAIERSLVLACQLLLAVPETKRGRAAWKTSERGWDKTAIPAEICLY